MNSLLQDIAEKASQDLRDLIEEGERDIIAAIHKMESEAQLQETKPKFSLGFKITVDLDKSTFDCDLSWTLKQSLSASHQIEDPAQGKLSGIAESASKIVPKGVESVTISSGGKSVTIDEKSNFRKKGGAK